MRKILHLAMIVSCILLYTSCTSIKTIVIDTQNPAQITLPKDINNIGIVENAIPQPDTWGHTVILSERKGKKVDKVTSVSSDSTIVSLCNSLFDKIVDLNHFDNVSIYESPLRNDMDFMERVTIDSSKIVDISNILNSDAIISIDRFIIQTSARTESFDFDTNINYLDLKMGVLFSIYSKMGKQISNLFSINDSIYWMEVRKDNVVISDNSLPTREEAIKEGSSYIAEKIANSFTPNWTQSPRIYYGENKEANKKMETGKWSEALTIWQDVYEKENKQKKKARLANNIALGYELSDNLKEALRWIQISIDLFAKTSQNSIDQNYLLMATSYKELLTERYRDFKVLDLSK